MVETITPVVYGGRARWVAALTLHAAGAIVTAAVFGLALGLLGRALAAPWGRAGSLALAALAVLYAVAELPRVSMVVPQLRRQVPDWWREEFGWPVAATLYGAGLGIGFFTYLGHGTLVVVAAGAVAIGNPWWGALIVATFGATRGLSAAVSAGVSDAEESRRLVDRLNAGSAGRRASANAAVMVGVGGSALALAVRSDDGWVAFSAAVLACVFGWAAAAKTFGHRRWGRTLAAHELPRTIRRAASWGAPIAEALVPLLALLGAERAAAVWSLVLLVAFSIELVRVRASMGTRVPCGCFGGRSSIASGTLWARNAFLAGLAVVVMAFGTDAPVLDWPGRPGPGEVLPMLLATVGLAVAGLTAWRANAWLSGSRRDRAAASS
jgi:hypothetical protein